MSRDAVEEGLNMCFDALVSNNRDELSPSRAVEGVSVRGVDNLVKSVRSQINREITDIERDIDVQIDEFLNYFEGDFDRRRIMRTNPVHSNVARRRVVGRAEKDLMEHLIKPKTIFNRFTKMSSTSSMQIWLKTMMRKKPWI